MWHHKRPIVRHLKIGEENDTTSGIIECFASTTEKSLLNFVTGMLIVQNVQNDLRRKQPVTHLGCSAVLANLAHSCIRRWRGHTAPRFRSHIVWRNSVPNSQDRMLHTSMKVRKWEQQLFSETTVSFEKQLLYTNTDVINLKVRHFLRNQIKIFVRLYRRLQRRIKITLLPQQQKGEILFWQFLPA